jgi:hypothetical protein
MKQVAVETTDGTRFVGKDEKDVVRQMRDTQWNAPELKRDWMVEAADRATMVTGFRVRSGEGAVIFLSDLERAGLVTIWRSEAVDAEG